MLKIKKTLKTDYVEKEIFFVYTCAVERFFCLDEICVSPRSGKCVPHLPTSFVFVLTRVGQYNWKLLSVFFILAREPVGRYHREIFSRNPERG